MRNMILMIGLSLVSISTLAHGPTPQKAKESIIINVAPDKVWDLAKRFGDIAEWHPDLSKSEGDGLSQSGGKRTLTFQSGQTLLEELDYFSEQDREYSYRLKSENTQAFPASSYTIELKVTAGEQASQSVVTLKSRFYRGDTGNSPADSLSDAAAVKAMNQFLINGLTGLKNKLEP
ncbi:MAG: SRPBCC family protein [Methylomonas sp.]|uniref:SRPBCC family protein n=1 Tax=Methylomonas sp. TaxID=418 RepID=UPI0025E8F93E|nr:SRPBCC family protein [Methylomonas sp.]MCK9607035.1 SRPBCC family protein [Methylomonas sp.]